MQSLHFVLHGTTHPKQAPRQKGMTGIYEYRREDLRRLSNATDDKLRQDVSRDGFAIGDIGEVAVWLAKNGTPELRQRIAEQVMPEVMEGLGDFLRDHVLPGAFSRAKQDERQRGGKISRTKQKQNKRPK